MAARTSPIVFPLSTVRTVDSSSPLFVHIQKAVPVVIQQYIAAAFTMCTSPFFLHVSASGAFVVCNTRLNPHYFLPAARAPGSFGQLVSTIRAKFLRILWIVGHVILRTRVGTISRMHLWHASIDEKYLPSNFGICDSGCRPGGYDSLGCKRGSESRLRAFLQK